MRTRQTLATIGTALLLTATPLLAATPVHFSGVHTSAESLFIYGTSLAVAGQPAQPGDEVAVVSASGVLCGVTVVTQAGAYPAISVYKDDLMTPAVDGAAANEALSFRIWDASEEQEYGGDDVTVTFAEKKNADGSPYWTANLDVYRVDLAAAGASDQATIALTLAPGWNLLSLPFATAAGSSPKTILVDGGGAPVISGTVWAWSNVDQCYVAVKGTFSAKEGFWAYRPGETQAVTKLLTGTADPDNTIVLSAGWNLVGPSRTARVSETPGLKRILGLPMGWNAAEEDFEPVYEKTPIVRGLGYWIRCAN